ncbi:hypothetical protein [Xanthobacter versatilis]|uniref:hypothetical protein n=1 Tax=Xanthobacter autotrophicus (strain ATCC BAA-1158 / Py2) TaxID=78245 RepID=UPI0037290C88
MSDHDVPPIDLIVAPIWPQWQRLSRLLFSGQIAFNSELARWEATELDAEHGVRLRDRTMQSKYRVTLDEHLATLRDRSQFFEIILIKAYSLMDAHGRYVRYILDSKDFALLYRAPTDGELQIIFDIHLTGGVEAWGGKLLAELGRDWRIIDGKAGLIQTSILRNAFAHGYVRATQGMLDTAVERGASLPFTAGDPIALTFEQCRLHLSRIKSFCRRLDGGLVNLAKANSRGQ